MYSFTGIVSKNKCFRKLF